MDEKSTRGRDRAPNHSHLMTADKFQVGTDVWAKLKGFPWWPSKVKVIDSGMGQD